MHSSVSSWLTHMRQHPQASSPAKPTPKKRSKKKQAGDDDDAQDEADEKPKKAKVRAGDKHIPRLDC